ncbi:ABC transporter ATP-binding protein [Paenibacillus ginsengarvi]|uniref:ABC transporter ATP-binding protein n=1 Tax=Paenibacillus ginsengarvi TaxID=400777 RepID=A0A3B0ANI2_9BACL|nr:ABC transporter ATP-binding protein [Paenibacillus ginsengarvi]RKN60837.1 ABC transporter ATP-binding protein [Paenibacillus ginsengarvi]
MEYVLRTHHLSKHYRAFKAVDDVNISIQQGEIYGFLGQNGAGKTTTIRMIMGLIRPTEGYVELFGEKITGGSTVFDRIGSIIEFPGFYPNLTVVENLEIHRRLVGFPNRGSIEQALHTTGIWEARNRLAKRLSLGMKQRLGIARALLHQPELLILDEPTNGLDPIGIKEIRQLIIDLAKQNNLTILISSHILSEIEQLATKIGILHRGCLLEEVLLEELRRKNRNYIEAAVGEDHKTLMLLEQHMHITDYHRPEPGVIRIYERLAESAAINRLLVQHGVDVKEISVVKATLEDYFINLTGGGPLA